MRSLIPLLLALSPVAALAADPCPVSLDGKVLDLEPGISIPIPAAKDWKVVCEARLARSEQRRLAVGLMGQLDADRPRGLALAQSLSRSAERMPLKEGLELEGPTLESWGGRWFVEYAVVGEVDGRVTHDWHLLGEVPTEHGSLVVHLVVFGDDAPGKGTRRQAHKMVDRAEVDAERVEAAAASSEPTPIGLATPPMPTSDQRLRMWVDVDGDGELSDAEQATIAHLATQGYANLDPSRLVEFKSLDEIGAENIEARDRDGDGVLSAAELGEMYLLALDVNGDERLDTREAVRSVCLTLHTVFPNMLAMMVYSAHPAATLDESALPAALQRVPAELRPTPAQMLAGDTDGDGAIDAEEFAAVVAGEAPGAVHAFADTSGDGVLDLDELSAFLGPMLASDATGYDLDADGRIDRPELLAVLDALANLGPPPEAGAAPKASSALGPFAHLDVDGDGRISPQEGGVPDGEPWALMAWTFDGDGDGSWSAAEYANVIRLHSTRSLDSLDVAHLGATRLLDAFLDHEFAAVDADGNGALDAREWGKTGWFATLDHVDDNDDGRVQPEEHHAHVIENLDTSMVPTLDQFLDVAVDEPLGVTGIAALRRIAPAELTAPDPTAFDADRDRRLSRDEVTAWLEHGAFAVQHARLFDADGDGLLTWEEVATRWGGEEADLAFAHDADADGRLTVEEYAARMKEIQGEEAAER